MFSRLSSKSTQDTLKEENSITEAHFSVDEIETLGLSAFSRAM
jgi:hypothetical protein